MAFHYKPHTCPFWRINSRGTAQANKHVLMSSSSYNLKKYLRFIF